MKTNVKKVLWGAWLAQTRPFALTIGQKQFKAFRKRIVRKLTVRIGEPRTSKVVNEGIAQKPYRRNLLKWNGQSSKIKLVKDRVVESLIARQRHPWGSFCLLKRQRL